MAEPDQDQQPVGEPPSEPARDRGKTVHGDAANAGHRVLAPDDAEVEAYLEVALDAPAPVRTPQDRPPAAAVDPGAGRRRGPRFRQPVRPADRPPRPGTARLLGAAAPRHAPGGAGGPRRASHHPLGRSQLGLRRGGAQGRRLDLERPPPGPRHLLRRPADGAGAGRGRDARGQARVRPGHGPDHEGRRPVCRDRPGAAGLDEPRRLDHAPPEGFHATAQTDSTPYAGLPPRTGTCTASSSTPRSSTRRAARTCCATS